MSKVESPVKSPATEEKAPDPGGRGAASKAERFGWVVADSPGKFCMLPKSVLRVDPDYQRHKVSETRVANIAREWSWVACGALVVSERVAGEFFVVDGQHRKLAADKREDIRVLPCMVFGLPGQPEEACGFVRVNTNRSNPVALDRFNALCRAGDPDALEVRKMVLDSGYEFVRTTVGRDSGRAVRCVNRLLSSHREDPVATRLIWGLCVELCQDRVVHEHLFSGLFHLERQLRRGTAAGTSPQSLLDQHNREVLLRQGVDALLERMRAVSALHKKGGPRVYAEGVVYVLNQRRRSGRLPSMFTGPEVAE